MLRKKSKFSRKLLYKHYFRAYNQLHMLVENEPVLDPYSEWVPHGWFDCNFETREIRLPDQTTYTLRPQQMRVLIAMNPERTYSLLELYDIVSVMQSSDEEIGISPKRESHSYLENERSRLIREYIREINEIVKFSLIERSSRIGMYTLIRFDQWEKPQ